MTCIDLHVAVDRVGMFDVDVSGAVPSTMGLGNLALASVKKPRYLPQASNVRRGDGFPWPEDRTRRSYEFLHFMAARERIESRVELAKGDLGSLAMGGTRPRHRRVANEARPRCTRRDALASVLSAGGCSHDRWSPIPRGSVEERRTRQALCREGEHAGARVERFEVRMPNQTLPAGT